MNSFTRHFARVADSKARIESFGVSGSKGFWTPEIVAIAVFLGGYILVRLCEKFVTFVVPEWVMGEVSALYKWAPILIPIAFGLTYAALPRKGKNTDPVWREMFGQKRKRKRFTPDQKRSVGARQGWRCATCGSTLPAAFEVDHITPIWSGGVDRLENMQALCANCHADKTLHP